MGNKIEIMRTFRVRAKVIIIDYSTMTMDYETDSRLFLGSPVLSKYQIRKKYCTIFKEQLPILEKALSEDEEVNLLVHRKAEFDKKGNLVRTWDILGSVRNY